MFPDETRKRQERLSKQLYFLAEKVLDAEKNEQFEIIGRLQMIYKDGFKHSYSDLFPVILDIFKENNQYNIEYLSYNLEQVRSALEVDYSNGTKQFDDIYVQFTKLCDHLNLQISELSVFTERENRANDVNEKISAMNEELEQTTKVLKQTANDLEKANKKADSLQTELIAVLSIFAAIVITFSGGITFLGSVMTSIKDVAYFESVVLAAIICGMVIFNTIFFMMYMVAKITERSIFAKCLTKDCSCEVNDKECQCSDTRKIRKRMPYVFYFNLAAIIGIIVDMVIWFLDLKDIII